MMDKDTDIGGPQSRFPLTRHSVIAGVQSGEAAVRSRAWGTLVGAYWKPAYKYLRIKWRLSSEDAKDSTQSFFAAALEKSFFDRYDPQKGRFRTYLRTCLDGFVANEVKAAHRLKRGGNTEMVSLDFEDAEGEVRSQAVPDILDTEEYFYREWVRHFFAESVTALREECRAAGKDIPFAVFVKYDLEGPDAPERLSYAALAEEYSLPVTQVTNHLAWARREFRRIVLERLREVTASEQEFRDEARRLLGRDLA